MKARKVSTTMKARRASAAYLDKLFAQRRWCYHIAEEDFVPNQGYRVSICFEREPGRFPTGDWPYHGRANEKMPWFWGVDLIEARAICAQENERKLGLDDKDTACIVASTMGKETRTA